MLKIILKSSISLLLIIASFIQSEVAFGQVVPKVPSLMILPSDNWCVKRHYTKTLDDQGSTTILTDYARAFREDSELGSVISSIGGLLAEKGFVVKDAEQAIKNLQVRTAENNATLSRGGDILAESDLDIIKNQVKADILIQINWDVLKSYSGNALQLTLEALDCYNDIRIPATITGTDKVSKLTGQALLEARVKRDIEPFSKGLQDYYDNLIQNGRTVRVNIRRWAGWDFDLDSEFEGESLIDIIDNWMTENAFNGIFNLTGSDENIATFEQVQIPCFNNKGHAIDARNFGSQLRSMLHNQYGITSKIFNRGLGEVTLVLGEQ